MTHNLDKYQTILSAKTKDELNVIAKHLNISGFRKIGRDALIENILQTEQKDKLSSLLAPSWWGRYHNHIYGVGGIVLGLVGIVLAYQWSRPSQRASVTFANDFDREPQQGA